MAGLKARLSALSAELDAERAARQLAADEAAARVGAKAAAEARAQQLEAENAALLDRLMVMKSHEAERLNEINRLHEDALENAKRWQVWSS